MIIKWIINRFKKQPKQPEKIDLGFFGLDLDLAYSSNLYVVALDDRHDTPSQKYRGLYDWCVENDCQYGWDRVLWDKWSNRWLSNGIGGGDKLFIIAKDADTAFQAKLIWG